MGQPYAANVQHQPPNYIQPPQPRPNVAPSAPSINRFPVSSAPSAPSSTSASE